MAEAPTEKTTEQLIKEKPASLKRKEKEISTNTAPVEAVPVEVKAEYETLPLPEAPVEVAPPITKTINDIDVNNPQEGDSYIDERGDSHIFLNGAWIVIVGDVPAIF